MDYVIRRAVEDDARGIVEVNTATWFTTYKGIISDEILEKRVQTMDERTEKTKELIREFNSYFVAVHNNKVIGIMSYGECKNEKYSGSGEIYSLYLLDEYHGKGIGKELFLRGVKELIDLGYKTMIINVLQGNKTIHFYEKYGGVNVDSRSQDFGSFSLNEYVMYYDDINKLYNNYK